MLSFWLVNCYSSSDMELPFYYFIYHLAIVSSVAVILDLSLGDPRRFHPLSIFGRVAEKVEKIANPYHRPTQIQPGYKNTDFSSLKQSKLLGLICCLSLVILICLVSIVGILFVNTYWLGWLVIDSVILYFCIGLTSMRQHVLAIATPLEHQQLDLARNACAMIVSRDVEYMTAKQMCRAAVESTLENTNDAVIASLFWYLIGGIPLTIAHRLVNTLDAMWGYKTERYSDFGWASAKLDDILGWPTAKITGFLFAIQSLGRRDICVAIRNAQNQSLAYKSRNGGYVMSAGATVMGIQLGGEASYHGVSKSSGQLGSIAGNNLPIEVQHIRQAIKLMNNAVYIWLAVILIVSISLLLFQSL